MKAALASGMLAGLVLVGLASAAKPLFGPNDPFELTVTLSQGAGAVEQQPGVENTTGCMWTIDDRHMAMGGGYLDPGVAVTDSYCLIADGQHHLTGVQVDAPSPDLFVTVSFQPQDVAFTLTAAGLDRGYRYRGCVVGPVYGDWPSLEEISGGHGRQTTITVTVANPTGRRVKNVTAQLETGSSEPSRQTRFCAGGAPGEFFQAGSDDAVWQTGL